MSISTLLFSTNLRAGYADVAALQAAILAGTHPIWADTSSGDLADRMTFDDSVQYAGAGTVKDTGSYFDHVPGIVLTDAWSRAIIRHSPTYRITDQPGGTGAGWNPNLYDDNVNYAAELFWGLYQEPGAAELEAVAKVIIDGGGEQDGGALSLASLRGQWRDFIVHQQRTATEYQARVWMDRALVASYAVALPIGFPDMTVIEPANFPPGPTLDPDNDYLHYALLEAYSGGNPYDLPSRPPTHRRNARRLALGLLYEETIDPRSGLVRA